MLTNQVASIGLRSCIALGIAWVTGKFLFFSLALAAMVIDFEPADRAQYLGALLLGFVATSAAATVFWVNLRSIRLGSAKRTSRLQRFLWAVTVVFVVLAAFGAWLKFRGTATSYLLEFIANARYELAAVGLAAAIYVFLESASTPSPIQERSDT